MIQKDPAKALHESSDRLAVDDRRIDGASDILDSDVVEDLNPACTRIDCKVAGMRTIAVSPDRRCESALHFEAGEVGKGPRLLASLNQSV